MKEVIQAMAAISKGKSVFQIFATMVMICSSVAFITLCCTILIYPESFKYLIDRIQGHKPLVLEESLQDSKEINALLRYHRDTIGVDRLYVSKFHNSVVDLTGVHFVKLSRIAEADGNGVSNELRHTQELPIAMFPEPISEIVNKQCYYSGDVASDNLSSLYFLQTMGVKSEIICPIYDTHGSLIGIIGAEGVINEIDKTTSENYIASMHSVAVALGAYLE